jgi:hypothetical protein
MTTRVSRNAECRLAMTLDLEEEKPVGANPDPLTAYPDPGSVRKKAKSLAAKGPKTLGVI